MKAARWWPGLLLVSVLLSAQFLGKADTGAFEGNFDPILHPSYWQINTYQSGLTWIGGPPYSGFRLQANYPTSASDPATAGLIYQGNANGGVIGGTTIRFNWVLDTFDVAGGTSIIFNYAGTSLTLVDAITDPRSGSVEVALAPGDKFGWLLSTPVSKSAISFEVDAFEATVPELIPGWLPCLVLLGMLAFHWRFHRLAAPDRPEPVDLHGFVKPA